MKTFFKQLFCGHIYKEDRSRREILKEGCLEPLGGTGHYDVYDVCVVYIKCLKCNKSKIKPVRIPSHRNIMDVLWL